MFDNKTYQQEWYRQHKSEHKQRAKLLKRAVVNANRIRVLDYLRKHPCVDCGESDIIVLEFDHVRGTKSGSISDMIKDGVSWKRISEEISKCEVRCANDHIRKTSKANGSYRLVL